MLKITVPGFEPVTLMHLVCDFSGTLSVDGKLVAGVKERLNQLSEALEIHILTADTHGGARKALEGVKAKVHVLEGETHSLVKADYVRKLGADTVVAVGNGNNDRKMLRIAKISIAVCIEEGCAARAVEAADLLVTSATDALDLLLNPNRLIAGLRT
jgi:P-type E1-E2 ATPase